MTSGLVKYREKMIQYLLLCAVFTAKVLSTDITSQVFGSDTDVLPSAFGDFNSDEQTDLFVLRDHGRTIKILLGSNEAEPLLKDSNLTCTFKSCVITSVVPGDFNGDAFMDVLITKKCHDEYLNIDILWGQQTSLNCTHDEEISIIESIGEPLALDYNNDFIIDLFGVDRKGRRVFWTFQKNGEPLVELAKEVVGNLTFHPIRAPHSNAYLDLNNDFMADLFVTSGQEKSTYMFEVWNATDDEQTQPFELSLTIRPPFGIKKIGQSLFLDLESKGKMDHILPVFDGKDAKIYVYSNKQWVDLKVDLKDKQGVSWWFFTADHPEFLKTVTLRGGDYNMDGYPDVLATLTNGIVSKTYLLENSPCIECKNFSRTFTVTWNGFGPNVNSSTFGVFYDIFQDGILDVILVNTLKNGSYKVSAYKNNLDYDANFVKVMVLTGLTNNEVPVVSGPLGKKTSTFGTNLPGPRISYKTLDQDGYIRFGVSAQIPQSAHYSLNLPYTTFALGRTPNFVDNITVGFASRHRDWPQVIPNSQMVIIPSPIKDPSKWKMQLFVTPSKIILMSMGALAVTLVLIGIVILVLHAKERRMDRLERLQEAHRFHFDAM